MIPPKCYFYPYPATEECKPITRPNRLLSKLAAGSKVQGASERKTGEYTPVCEDLSTEATQQFASAVKFRKKSNVDIRHYRRSILREEASVRRTLLFFICIPLISLVNPITSLAGLPAETTISFPILPIISHSPELFSTEEKIHPLTIAQPSSLVNKQVLIKAHIVNIDHSYTRSLGLVFNTFSSNLRTKGGFTMNLPSVEEGTGEFSFPIAKLNQGILLNATLKALEDTGHAQLISDPQLVTLNGQPAIIEAGEEVPYQQTTSNGGTSIAFKKAVLRLQVTPEIQINQNILLHLTINQDQVSTLTVNGVPAINTRQLRTQVLVKDRSTLVLGGIFESDQSEQHQQIPGLNKIPLIGLLFRNHEQIDNRKQLLIFITPRILPE